MTVCIRPGTNRKDDITVVDDGIAQQVSQKIAAEQRYLQSGLPGIVQRAVEKEAERLRLATPRNKYDRVIHGKYDTGKCTVDVYRVLNAFGPLSPEIDHAVKKLLAPGQCGAKGERQDLLEAIQSIEARLQYLEATDD